MTFPIAADVNETALAIFAIVVGITLFVTYLASKRMTGAVQFYAAGRAITGPQNGFAIAGDYMSAASFLGIAGLIFLFGFDGFLYSVGFLVAFLTVLFLLSERMRNSGKFTIADVLSFRMNERPARAAAALGTLSVAGFYLIAQMVGAGVLIEALVGIDFSLAVRPHRRLHAHLRDLRRHARHDLGADHQGHPADDRDDRVDALRAQSRSAGTRSICSTRQGTSRRRATPISSPACSWRARSTRSRSASAWCWERPDYLTSLCVSSRCPTPRPPGRP